MSSTSPIADVHYPLWQRFLFGLIFVPLCVVAVVLAGPIVVVGRIVLPTRTYHNVLNGATKLLKEQFLMDNTAKSYVAKYPAEDRSHSPDSVLSSGSSSATEAAETTQLKGATRRSNSLPSKSTVSFQIPSNRRNTAPILEKVDEEAALKRKKSSRTRRRSLK